MWLRILPLFGVGLYILACALPAIGRPPFVLFGWKALLLGVFGLFKGFAWLANIPWFFGTLFFLWNRKRVAVAMLALATVLALTLPFIDGERLGGDWGTTAIFHAGAWVWVASIATQFVFAAVCRMVEKWDAIVEIWISIVDPGRPSPPKP